MFKIIPDFPNYEINIKGEVRNKNTGKYSKPFLISSGLVVCIRDYRNCRITKSIAAMLKQTFPIEYIDYLDTERAGYDKEVTLAKLREVFHYNPDTGEITILSNEVAIYGSPKLYKSFRWNKAMYLLHHIIYFYQTGYMVSIKRGEHIDHIDHDRTNHKWDNIRIVDAATNSKNMSLFVTNTSGTMGVNWNKNRNRWVARIRVNGKDYALGSYKDKQDAIAAREAALVEHGFHPNHGK